MTELVALEEHGNALGEGQRGDEVPDLLQAQGGYIRGGGFSLHAVVSAQVVVGAVAVGFAVRLVVLVLVGNLVAKSETVMGGHKVDARGERAAAEHVGAPGDASNELAVQTLVAAPEAADAITIATVPLPPGRRKTAQLVAAIPEVPGLRDEL